MMHSKCTLVIVLFSAVSAVQFEDYIYVIPKTIKHNYKRDVQTKPTIDLQHWILDLKYETNTELFEYTKFIKDYESTESNECVNLRGGVKNELDSFAVITQCENYIYGMFESARELMLIEPASGDLHKIKRRKREADETRFNLTGDTFGDFLDVKLNYDSPELDEHNSDIHVEEDVGYFYDAAWQPNYVAFRNHTYSSHHTTPNPKRWIEIAVAVDSTVISFHGRKTTEYYILALMNIVNAIYQDPSLAANVQLVITRVFMYEHNYRHVVHFGDAKRSLENVNIWNRQTHIALAPGETHHDLAVWLTRNDIGGPSGYAPVGGVCDWERSCTLNRDEGLSSAFIIAHEMGHILGMRHDGDKKSGNDCVQEAQQGSVMADIVSSTFSYFFWSKCSRNEFAKSSKKFACLLNPPKPSATLLQNTMNISFSMDEQCRMEFGEGYTLCRAFDVVEPCTHLWCGHIKSPLVCKTKKGPPLEGTICGLNKMCIEGYCQIIDNTNRFFNPVQLNPQDGGWSSWSKWSPCSRTCNTGVRFKSRKCNNPEPLNGGSECKGPKEEWEICNMEACPEPQKDIRAQQCKRLPKLLHEELNENQRNMTWLPFEPEDVRMKCKLICASLETKELYVSGENFLDGTPCSYTSQNNICVQGVCQTLGCDRKLFSQLIEDVCGICGGNGKECSEIIRTGTKQLLKEKNRLLVLPRYARNIKITANFSVNKHISFALKDRRRNSYSISIPNTKNDNQIIEGAKFYYKRTRNVHQISAVGPILAEVTLFAFVPRALNSTKVSIETHYFMQKHTLNATKRYEWIIGGWGPCSKSCGGGRRVKTKACWDKIEKKIAPRRKCLVIPKPNLEYQTCNTFSCDFVWVFGPWEACSRSCGSFGEQSREIYCVPAYMRNVTDINLIWKKMVAPTKCGETNKPIRKRACHRRSCPAYWEYGEWTECSSTCGVGFMYRDSTCLQPENEVLFSCPERPPKQRTICDNTGNSIMSAPCKSKKLCLEDVSRYCALPLFARYCRIPGFKKICCKSCSKLRNVAH